VSRVVTAFARDARPGQMRTQGYRLLGQFDGLMMSHNETGPAAETSYAALAGCTKGGDGIGAAWVVGSVSCMLDTFSAPSDGTIVA
jgi:hypothetical protein